MTRFVIHLGPHKTGTTYLQEAFVQFRSALLDRGICYPAWWGPKAHYGLFERLREPPNAELEAQFAQLQAENHDTILISVEGLVDLPERSIHYLKQLIGDASASIVFYARSWGDVLPSTWREIVKEGSVMTLPEFAYQRVANPWSASTTNFALGLDIYSEIFGKDSINIVCYNQVMAEKIDLFQHFAVSFLAWSDAPRPALQNVNVSLGYSDTETIRALNSMKRATLGSTPPTDYSLSFTACYLNLKSTFNMSGIRDAQAQDLSELYIDETSPTLRTLHREIFARYESAVVPPKPPRLLFTPRLVQIPYARSNYLTSQSIVTELNEIHRRISAELVR